MPKEVPWKLGNFNFPAYGMREAILRVDCMTPTQCKEYFIHRGDTNKKFDSLYHALRLRIVEPDKFDELVKIIKGGDRVEQSNK